MTFVMSHIITNFEHQLLDKDTNYGKRETDQDAMQRVDTFSWQPNWVGGKSKIMFSHPIVRY